MQRMEDIIGRVCSGLVARCDGQSESVDSLPWNAHPAFAGVELKHLVTGADTQGATSLHVVRVAPGCSIGEHVHSPQWELHEVLAGSGECFMDGLGVAYAPGVTRILPPDRPHEVRAGKEGLHLLAVFAPALV
ncbi:MAG: cupin domain-containing protein [Desulfovibrionaceae bacterium]